MASSASPVGNIRGPQGNTGPASWQTPPVAWAASTAYTASAPASVVTYQGATYVCSTSHTSTSSFVAGNWTLIAASGSAGARGASMFSGLGAPSAAIVAGAVAGQDSYVDLASGNTYQFS